MSFVHLSYFYCTYIIFCHYVNDVTNNSCGVCWSLKLKNNGMIIVMTHFVSYLTKATTIRNNNHLMKCHTTVAHRTYICFVFEHLTVVNVTSQLGRLSLLVFVGWSNEFQPSGWVILLNGDGGCGIWQPTGGLAAKSIGFVWGSAATWGTELHSSDELSELSKWFRHDDNTY